MICVDIHILILRQIDYAKSVAALLQGKSYVVALAPVVPVADAAMREHERCSLIAVECKGADACLVFRIYRAIAVSIAEIDRIDTGLWNLNYRLERCG